MTTKPPRKTWIALAKTLGISRTSLQNFRTLPDSPTVPDVKAWRTFIAKRGLGRGHRVSEEREVLLTARLREEVAAAKFRRLKDQGRYVLRADVNALMGRVALLIRGRLYAALEREYPGRVVGRSPSEIAAIGRALADELVDFMRDPEGDSECSNSPAAQS